MEETKDLQGFIDDLNVYTLQELEDLRRRPDILQRIRFDVTPRMIMEPRIDSEEKGKIAGCSFYIETFEPPPTVMLLKVNRGGVMSTIGKVSAVPPELVEKAVASPVEPPVNGMYAITDEIRDWLTKALGL